MAKKYALTGSTRAFNGFAKGLIRLGVPTANIAMTAPYFDAKPGDPVERFAAEAGKHPVFEILPS